MADDQHHSLPSLTLIFTTADRDHADSEHLLDISWEAITAIEESDPRFSILKAYTFNAGRDYVEDLERIHQLENGVESPYFTNERIECIRQQALGGPVILSSREAMELVADWRNLTAEVDDVSRYKI